MYRRRLMMMAKQDNRYAIIKPQNNTFDLSCLTDGIVEYQDTDGDTQHIAGSATGTINIYPDSEVKITKASQIQLKTGQTYVETHGIKLVQTAQAANSAIAPQIIAENCTIEHDKFYNWKLGSTTLSNVKLINTSNNNADELVLSMYARIADSVRIADSTMQKIIFNSAKQSGIEYSILTRHVVVKNLPNLTTLYIYSSQSTNIPLEDVTIIDCPNLNSVHIQSIAANPSRTAALNEQAVRDLLTALPTRPNADGVIYLNTIQQSTYNIHTLPIDDTTAEQYLHNKGWTISDTKLITTS